MAIDFNTLKIYNGQLIIDISVSNDPFYENTRITDVYIDTQDTFDINGPSQDCVYHINFEQEEELPKEWAAVLTSIDLDNKDLSSNMFFIYVKNNEMFSPSINHVVPCGADDVWDKAVVVDMEPFYIQAMSYVRELSQNCCKNQKFIDYILKLKALELAVKTGNYLQAIKYYNNFFLNKTTLQGGGCSCGY